MIKINLVERMKDTDYYRRLSELSREHVKRAMLKGAEGIAYLVIGVGGAAILIREQNPSLSIAAVPALYLAIGPGLDAICESFEDLRYA